MNEGRKGSHKGAPAIKKIVEKKDQEYTVKCYTCGYMFHAVGCPVKNYNVSSPSSFINQLLPAVSKLNLTRISLGGCCLSVTSVSQRKRKQYNLRAWYDKKCVC